MNYEIRLTPSFQRQLKIILKKYPLVRSGLDAYLKSMKNQLSGNRIPGHPNLVKDRIALKPYRIGKSGGLRIIYYHAMGASLVFPLLIYSKSDMPNPPHNRIVEAVKELETILNQDG